MARPILIFTLALVTTGAAAGDLGRDVYNRICSDCHDVDYFQGEDVDQLKRNITKISRGELKHKKKYTLTDEEIVAIATFLNRGG